MKMKGSNVCPTLLYDDEEIEVANILLDLRKLIRQSDFRVKLREPEIPAGLRFKTEVLSPATPLSFSPSESDEKPVISSRKHSKKRTREEWMKNVDELTQCKEVLIGQLENVRAYYNNQLAYNLKLKAMRQEILSTSQKVEEPSGPDTRAGQGYPQFESPIIIDPLGQRYQYQGLVSAQNGMGYLVGPIGIPDLNVSVVVGSSQPFDVQRMEGGDKKTRYAEARRYRMVRNKSKIKGGPRSTTLPSFPCRR
nr:Peptide chain release factor 1 like [Ipomoea batatas]